MEEKSFITYVLELKMQCTAAFTGLRGLWLCPGSFSLVVAVMEVNHFNLFDKNKRSSLF